ncbi:hypothetical protein PSTT_15733, partial [Puccinia striiformis]
LGRMAAHSLEDDEKFDGTCTPPLTHVLSSEEYNSSWDKLHITTRKTMLSTSPQHTQSRLRTFLLISLLVSQSIGVIGFFTSVFISLGPYVSSDSDRGYQDTLGYLVIFTIATVFEVYIVSKILLYHRLTSVFAARPKRKQCRPSTLSSAKMLRSWSRFAYSKFNDWIGASKQRGRSSFLTPPSTCSHIKFTELLHTMTQLVRFRLLVEFHQMAIIVVPAIIGVATVIMSWLTWHFSQDFGGEMLISLFRFSDDAGWHAYKKLGANIALRKAMRVKSVFYLLQKFCFFFLVGFCVLIVQMRKQSQGVLQTLDIVFPVLSLIVSGLVQIFTSIAVELELRFFVFIYGIFWLAALFFVGYEIIEIHPLSEATESQHTLILFSSLTILLLFSKMIVSIFCHMNFNKGLKGAEDSYIIRLFSKKASFETSASHSAKSTHKLQRRAVLD